MWMPSIASNFFSQPLPVGQMMETTWPASRIVVAACHSRRSNGLGRFSTSINTLLGRLRSVVVKARSLPAKSFVDPGDAARLGDAHQVDDGLPLGEALRDVAEFRRGVADDDGVGVREHFLDAGNHQARDVRDVVQDVVAVGPV